MDIAEKGVVYNLNTTSGRAAVGRALEESRAFISLDNYLRTGIPGVVYKDIVVVEHETKYVREVYAIKDGRFYELDSYYLAVVDIGLADIKNEIKGVPAGVILPTPIRRTPPDDLKNKTSVFTILQNGDEDHNGLVESLINYNFPTVSFGCLGRFYHENDSKGSTMAIKAIQTGQLKVLDFTPDSYKAISRGEGDALAIPPEPGYTVTGRSWHRPATVVFWDKAHRMTLLLGQDEDSYFGVELPGAPKTVCAAFDALVPKELKKRGHLERQGEWYIVPVETVPTVSEAVIIELSVFTLPVEHSGSNYHVVHCQDGRVDKKGVVYAYDISMEHDDHATVEIDGWHTFVRNTAKRSYSKDGVD